MGVPTASKAAPYPPGLAWRRAYAIGGAFELTNVGNATANATADSKTNAATNAKALAITAGLSGKNSDATATAQAAKGLTNNQYALAVNDPAYNYLVPIAVNTLLPTGWPGDAAESAYLQSNFGAISAKALAGATTGTLQPVPIPTP